MRGVNEYNCLLNTRHYDVRYLNNQFHFKLRMKNGFTFVKWAGGKTQLLSQFEEFIPKEFNKYIEPFVGGGAVFFHILSKFPNKETIISDNNFELINTYEIIRDNLIEFISLISKHKEKHNKNYYYIVRALEKQKLSKVERAARFVYLNKTCFNGLYRENSKGNFNVPIGSYNNPQIFDIERLKKINKFLSKTKIKNQSFEKVLDDAQEGDFVYFDPPYYPLNETSFTKYLKDDFGKENHIKLAEIFKKLDKKGVLVMLSNSNTEFIKKLYIDYKQQLVKARRSINSNGRKRGKINEVVIMNY